ncbi:hypothetical protein IWQ60_008039 [Tieghemiomyces parasiticus]|uniref:Uncharacterized protein n=1 Tax=Tieghemiomyces parasiticus TaxID=78921 RepID=A0A9W7ZZU1_9FUNG|nr:hypothetical protein IWQ60_008039 [Tieghemiomyces parasiticus]
MPSTMFNRLARRFTRTSPPQKPTLGLASPTTPPAASGLRALTTSTPFEDDHHHNQQMHYRRTARPGRLPRNPGQFSPPPPPAQGPVGTRAAPSLDTTTTSSSATSNVSAGLAWDSFTLESDFCTRLLAEIQAYERGAFTESSKRYYNLTLALHTLKMVHQDGGCAPIYRDYLGRLITAQALRQ